MIISSPEAMMQLGKDIAQKEKKILLYGPLGAGKTLFVKGFAMGLGINPDIIQSPTYTYINEYDNKILHLDLYRLESEKDLIEKGILDKINEYEYILMEWPRFEDHFVTADWKKIEIQKIDFHTREIKISDNF